MSPIIRFGDPSDGARISVENAHFSPERESTTAARQCGSILRLQTGRSWRSGRLKSRRIGQACGRSRYPWTTLRQEPVDLLVRVGDDPNAGGDQHALTGRVRVRAGEALWPGLFDVAAEDQRGPAYAAYLHSALANPDIVGCHWFQYVDEPLTGRLLDGENGQMGFVSVADVRYPGLVSAARQANLTSLKSLR